MPSQMWEPSNSNPELKNEVHSMKKTDSFRIILDIPIKKNYLGNWGFFKNQSAQKGGTCWYYVLNYLRVRYGKEFPKQDYSGRRVEKVFSSHRKQINKIESKENDFFKLVQSINFEYQEEKITKKIVQDRLRYYLENNLDFLVIQIQICRDFLNQSQCDDFESYLIEEIQKDHISNCQDTLQKLGLNPEERFNQYLTEQGPNFLGDLDLSTKYSIYSNIIYLEAIKKYHLKISAWHPCDGIFSLIQELKEMGAMAVLGQFCRNQEPTKVENINGRPIYAYDPEYSSSSEMELGSDIGHAVLIIGAETNNGQDYVYYLDPNDSSESSKIYKILYSELTTRLSNVYSNKYPKLSPNIPGPFAVYADKFWREYELESLRQQELAIAKG